MLVSLSVTYMCCFVNYSDAAPHAKTMGLNGITNFILNVSKCITFNQTKILTETLITEAWLKSFYSRLGFKFIEDFVTYPKLEEACEIFHYKSGKPKEFQKQTIGLQCYLTIPRRITIIYDNSIKFNKYIYVYKNLNEVSTSYDGFSYEYIYYEVISMSAVVTNTL